MEDIDDFETVIKVIVVGNGQVGKSSMTQRYCKGDYTDAYKKTIGVDFLEKVIDLEDLGESVRLMIWDTAGQEEFDSLTSSYYRGAGCAVLVFSTVDRASFDQIRKWHSKVTNECDSIPMVLVQNKVDLIDSAAMTHTEVEELARELRMRLYRTSVKDNVNVADVFEYLSATYIEQSTSGTLGMNQAIDDIGVYAAKDGNSSPAARSPLREEDSSNKSDEECKNEENTQEHFNVTSNGTAQSKALNMEDEHDSYHDDIEETELNTSEHLEEEYEPTDGNMTSENCVQKATHEQVVESTNQPETPQIKPKRRTYGNMPPAEPVRIPTDAFKLQPAKRRATGKKKKLCSIL